MPASDSGRRIDPRRQQNRERRAHLHFARHRDLPAVIANDAVADAQPESRALTDLTRREERVEDAADVLVVDAVAGVADEELDRRRSRVEPRADGQPASRRARASRVRRSESS